MQFCSIIPFISSVLVRCHFPFPGDQQPRNPDHAHDDDDVPWKTDKVVTAVCVRTYYIRLVEK